MPVTKHPVVKPYCSLSCGRRNPRQPSSSPSVLGNRERMPNVSSKGMSNPNVASRGHAENPTVLAPFAKKGARLKEPRMKIHVATYTGTIYTRGSTYPYHLSRAVCQLQPSARISG